MFKYFILVIFLWSGSVSAQTSQLSMFAASPTHPGVYAPDNHTSLGDIKWAFKTGGKVFSSPAVYNKAVYIGSGDSSLYAIDKTTGKLLWKFITGGPVHSSPAVYKNVVYFGSYDGFYYALNAKTGKLKWKFKTGGEKKVGAKGLWTMKPDDMYMDDPFDFFLSSPVIGTDNHDPIIYFGSSDGNLYALHARTGEKKWAFKTNGLIHSSPALYNSNVYFGSWDTFLYAVDAQTGDLKWKFETDKQLLYHLLEGIQASPACSRGMVYIGSRDGHFYALDAYSGKLVWKYAADNSWVLTTAAIKDSMVYFGTSDTYLFLGFDAKTGKEKIRYKTNGYVYSSPALTSNTAYFGDFTGNLCAVDINSGRLTGRFETSGRLTNAKSILDSAGNINFSLAAKGKDLAYYDATVYGMDRLYTLGSIVSSPAISNGVIYFGSADNYVYAISLK
ncbi:PQQ-binding-like beta-propeller repeat protein [Mucilaginibacter sp. BT774]|uniref:PQQ-binding-like beta-propeller repeat protein n=1 Tax=Mucilaginibacter sp. BT774 TaxID=3062276 RepID=UPI002676974C|nr:PQQ-binding-like beta-propeller repeat protein [Mucilaginibacter sp. BT774]MDO3624866.1 PQQ-binding-like beta-propeller repeat protein [Mucilaginibacter sp. BT774]